MLLYIIMPLSKQISQYNLKPDKKYLIEVQWNITNNLRLNKSVSFIGTFVDYVYVRGRTHSFDSGLQLLTSRSRYEAIFNVDGVQRKVSTVNKFFEVLIPNPIQFANVYRIYTLPLPNVLKREIRHFLGHVNKLYYKTKHEMKIKQKDS